MKKKTAIPFRGLPVGKLNRAMSIITITISAMLLFSTYRSNVMYKRMQTTTSDYIAWNSAATNLIDASDYLTEQARCFAVTGNIDYLNNYFQEADVTQRREKALNTLKSAFGQSNPYTDLENAMKKSVELMERECLSMRLMSDACGYAVDTLPEAVRNTELPEEYKILSNYQKTECSRSLVFDSTYNQTKSQIVNNVEKCLKELKNEAEKMQQDASDRFAKVLLNQQILIISMIVIVLTIVITTSLLLISPLVRAIWHVRTEQPIPLVGSYEFRYLAKTYNLMYEANREKREHLVYEAMHDSLTGLYNRNGYEFLIKNIEPATSVLLIFDVDKFKNVNDTYGHETGDRLLAAIAETIFESFRSQDYVCRIGGDEFAVIMTNISVDITDLIDKKVEHINDELSCLKDLPKVSVSVGAAKLSDSQSFKDADLALYRVKSHGGKGIEFSENE